MNYIVYDKLDGSDPEIVKTFGPPTYQRVELDPAEAYQQVSVSSTILSDLLPTKHSIYQTNYDKFGHGVFCSPVRKVMVRIDVCDFCERTFTEKMHVENTDYENREGYFYCAECTPILYDGLKNSGTGDIWYLRERKQVWIPRTRRDENGQRIQTGPYTFEKWTIRGWYAYDKVGLDGINKPHVTCDGEEYSKSVAIDIIKKANPEANPNYCPNDDMDFMLSLVV